MLQFPKLPKKKVGLKLPKTDLKIPRSKGVGPAPKVVGPTSLTSVGQPRAVKQFSGDMAGTGGNLFLPKLHPIVGYPTKKKAK